MTFGDRASSADLGVDNGLENLRDFIENAAVGAHSLGADGVILWANRAELELLGYERQEYVGHSIADFHVDQDASRDILARLARGEALHDHEARLRAKDGSIKHVLISSNASFQEGQFVRSRCFMRDVTERKSLEGFRAVAADRAERLVRVTSAIADAVTEAEVFEALVDEVAAAVDASTAALWVRQDDGGTLQLARSFGLDEKTTRSFARLPLDAAGSSPALDAVLRGKPVWIPSQDALLRAYPHLRDDVSPGRSYRVSCLPLIARGRVLGCLGLTMEEETAKITGDEGDEQDFLLLVAWYAAHALERLRLLAAERENRQLADAVAARAGVLSRASRAFVTADFGLGTRLREIAAELGGALGGCAAISLITRDQELRTLAVYHPVQEAQYALQTLVETTRLRVGGGVTATVAATGESALIPETDANALAGGTAPAYRALLERYPAYAMICAPLRAGDTVTGTITAMRVRAGETYTREDLLFLEELADRAGPAIEISRLHAEKVSALSRAEQLHQFARSVVTAEKVESVFEAALDAIERGLGTTRSAILICDDHGVMRFRASRHLSAEYRKAVEGYSPWPSDAVAPEPVLVPDVETDAAMRPFLPRFRQEGIRSLAFVPLVTRGRLIGKFMVYFSERHRYASHEIELASAIAHHLASVTARFAAIARLEETIRYNDLFAGVLAHDLRNPLGAMMTAAQLVIMRHKGETKPLSRIIASGQRMFRMIDQLLDVTRARIGGGIKIAPRETNLADVCDQAIDELELAHPDWHIKREARGDLDGVWDPDRLLQIVSNLVSNAGQHGQQGRPIAVRLGGERADAVTLAVHNQGVIPKAMLATLFDPLKSAAERIEHTRGLGLGLFIVKEIVEAHAGSVQVASSAPDGTVFTVTLPRRSPRSAAFEPGRYLASSVGSSVSSPEAVGEGAGRMPDR